MRALVQRICRLLERPAAIGAAAGLAVVFTSLLGTWDVAELKLLDRHLRLRGPVRSPDDVTIVGIGEDTFAALGRPWPFPRALTARAIEIIAAGKPAAIGVDLLFTEPSIFGPEDDEALAVVLRRQDNVVLGAFSFREVEAEPVGGPGKGVRRTYQVLRLPAEPFPRGPVGFVNILHDADGFVRRVPLFVEFRTAGRFESFAGQLVNTAALERKSGASSGRQMLINFRGPTGSFGTVPFHRVLHGEAEPHRFARKIVLIGATSPVLHDVFFTPFTPRDPMPGVEIQAHAVDNLLRGDPLRATGKMVALLLAVLAAVTGTRIGARALPPRSFVMVAIVAVGAVVIIHIALAWYGVWIEHVPMLLALFATYFAMLVSGAPFKKYTPLTPSGRPAE